MSETSDDAWGSKTRWSRVRRATDPGGAGREEAWRDLIARYREPVRRSLRLRLSGLPDIEARCDEFFQYVAIFGVLPKADPSIGKFRCYMQGVIRRYASGVRRQLERGAPLDSGIAERLSAAAPPIAEIDDDREWARGVLTQALARLAEEKPRDANALCAAYGIDGAAPIPREKIARDLGISRDAVDKAIGSARRRLGELLDLELRESVTDDAELVEELELMRARLIEACPGVMAELGAGR